MEKFVEKIEYIATSGIKGILYNWHQDEMSRKWSFSMRIVDRHGHEICHAYNAAPKTLEELKHVVDLEQEMVVVQKKERRE